MENKSISISIRSLKEQVLTRGHEFSYFFSNANTIDEVCEFFADNYSLPITKKEMERGLEDKDWFVRVMFARNTDISITEDQMKRGLEDEEPFVRASFALRYDVTPNAEQVKRGLEDPFVWVRAVFAQRDDIKFTDKQIEDGITDSEDVVRSMFARNTNIKLPESKLHWLLFDECNSGYISSTVVRRSDVTLTPKQVELLLNDPDYSTRSSIILRPDVTLTKERMASGLKDKDGYVRMIYQSLKNNRIRRRFYETHSFTRPNINSPEQNRTISEVAEEIVLRRASQAKKTDKPKLRPS